MTLLEAVNRIFRLNAIIRGDNDPITSFSDVQHNASTQLAIIAVQDEIGDLVSDRLIGNEMATATLSTVAGTRTYSLETDFVRFYGTPHFYLTSGNKQIYEYPGGLVQLQTDIFNYATVSGEPNWWYWEPSTVKKVGFYQVPNAAYTYSYDYERSVMVEVASDTMPFHNDEENYAFCQMAARRFKFMFEDVKGEADIQAILESDVSYRRARVRLIAFMRGQNPSRRYRAVYA